MAWVALATSGVQHAFVDYSEFGGSATWAGSVASVSTGTPPSSSQIGQWALVFDHVPGRPSVKLRLTAQSFASDGNPVEFATGTYDGSNPVPDTVLAEVANTSLSPATSWAPTPFEVTIPFTSGEDMGLFSAGTGENGASTNSFLVEVELPDPLPTCEEFGRTTRVYASGYDRQRVHVARLLRGETRCLLADFNGAIAKGRAIASATWRSMGDAVLSSASIEGRTTRCTLAASVGGAIRCEVTLDNGERYVQVIDLRVAASPWFEGETYATSGSKTITVTA